MSSAVYSKACESIKLVSRGDIITIRESLWQSNVSSMAEQWLNALLRVYSDNLRQR